MTIESLTDDERVYVGHHALKAGKKALRIIDKLQERNGSLESRVLQAIKYLNDEFKPPEVARELALEALWRLSNENQSNHG